MFSIFFILISFLIIDNVYADEYWSGKCTCFKMKTGGLMESFEEYCENSPIPANWKEAAQMEYSTDLMTNPCEFVCGTKQGYTGAYWYGTKYDIAQNYLKQCIEQAKTCTVKTEENVKGCKLVSDHDETPPSTGCTYSYSKDQCENSIPNGTWNTSTNCCDLTPICWWINTDGTPYKTSNLYYQIEDPCETDKYKTSAPQRVCKKVDIEESKCVTHDKDDYYTADIQKLIDQDPTHSLDKGMDDSGLGIDREKMSCTRILGKTLSKVVKGGIIVIQIVAGIVALIKGMMVLIPPLVAKDADALKKASGTLVKMGIILVLVLIFRPVARLLGTILDFDVSCIL